ncbi:MAG: phosphotransferase [Erythrobacter sp.]
MSIQPDALLEGLTRACTRAGMDGPFGLERLTGGATMESWRFETGQKGAEAAFVLRRAPSLEFIEDRPYGHEVEAAVIHAAHGAGVTAPEVMTVLEPEDGIGSGFVMRALVGTSNPKDILTMDKPDELLREAASDLARIHTLKPGDLPEAVPVMDYRAVIADFRAQFGQAGGDRPIIALGIKWLEDNCPDSCEPVLIHGDYRMGNLLAEDSTLTGVLDWELAHFGDPHEDLAFGCMAVWRFARYDRPALGLGSLEDYFAAYEAESGRAVDRERFRYWTIHRTVWWALGCLKCAQSWRDGSDRTLERAVISRRTSEQELDLLLLLEEDAPEAERDRGIEPPLVFDDYMGEAEEGELAMAISEWLGSIKEHLEGHDRFQLAVARNALGMLERYSKTAPLDCDFELTQKIMRGETTLASPEVLANLRTAALEKLMVDVPKYPALAVAREKWL